MSFIVITPCFNEERLLPFFLYYYRHAKKIHLFDDGSTDKSLEIASKFFNVVIHALKKEELSGGSFDERANTGLKNEAWKTLARGQNSVDFVIACDVDEFLYSCDGRPLHTVLEDINRRYPTVAFYRTQGVNMVRSDTELQEMGALDFDKEPDLLNWVSRGVFCDKYSKCVLFRPDGIHQMGYHMGCHACTPFCKKQSVPPPDADPPREFPRFRLLHFKYVHGSDYHINRLATYARRLPTLSREKGWGAEYLANENELREEYQKMESHSELKMVL